MAINLNHVMLSGTVSEDPQIVGEGDTAWCFIKLHTTYGMKLPDGSYTDADQICQLVCDVPHHVNTARNYIKKGKALACYCYYRTWQANGQTHHGFFVRNFTMAKPNYGGDANNTPPLPEK